MNAKWMLRRCGKNIKAISRRTGISETMAQILANRGITGADDIENFINPSLNKLIDPAIMKDMKKGTEIIYRAIEKSFTPLSSLIVLPRS